MENPNIVKANLTTVNSTQMVSVAFVNNLGKRSDFSKIYSLLDSDSPKSFIKYSQVPFKINKVPKPSIYRSIGNYQLKILDEIVCGINIGNEIIYYKLFVLPDEDISVLLIIGRDLLYRLNIFLCKLKRIYSKSELIETNENNFFGIKLMPLLYSKKFYVMELFLRKLVQILLKMKKLLLTKVMTISNPVTTFDSYFIEINNIRLVN